MNSSITILYFTTLIYNVKNGAEEDAGLKGDSPSTCSTETDSGVSEGCSDNGTSTEEDDGDCGSKGSIQVDGTAKLKNEEPTEDMLNGDLAQNIKVRWTVVLAVPPPSCVAFLFPANPVTYICYYNINSNIARF